MSASHLGSFGQRDASDSESTQIYAPILNNNQSPSFGKAKSKSRITTQDILALLISAICCVAGVLSIANIELAYRLGEIRQLVVLGLLLTVMGKAFQGRAQDLLINLEAQHFGSRLQNYDALLRNDVLADHASLFVRGILGLMFLLPLGLSAAYKTFTGGHVIRHLEMAELSAGVVGAPGAQYLGNGLSLMANASQAFLLQPRINKTYGYNMYIPENQTAVFMDAPMPDTVAGIRKGLDPNQMLQLSLDATGTVARAIPVSSKDWITSGKVPAALGWPSGYLNLSVPLFPGYFNLLYDATNHTYTCVSVWGGIDIVSRRGKFHENVQCVKLRRENCSGTWNITSSSATLAGAKCSGVETKAQRILENNFNALGQFADLLVEYITSRPERKSERNPDNVDIVVPAIGAALWARMTSLQGYADNEKPTSYEGLKYMVKPFGVSIQSSTLQQHRLLYMIILLYPVLTTIIIATRAMFYFQTPIDQGFGIVALLSGVEKSGLKYLEGASLSGQTIEPVSVRIVADSGLDSEDGLTTNKIRYVIGEKGVVGKIKKSVKYS